MKHVTVLTAFKESVGTKKECVCRYKLLLHSLVCWPVVDLTLALLHIHSDTFSIDANATRLLICCSQTVVRTTLISTRYFLHYFLPPLYCNRRPRHPFTFQSVRAHLQQKTWRTWVNSNCTKSLDKTVCKIPLNLFGFYAEKWLQ